MSVDHNNDVTVVWRDGEVLRKRCHFAHFSSLKPIAPLPPSFPEPETAPVEFVDLASFEFVDLASFE